MSETIISVSGLRGIIGDSLDPTLAMRYASAFLATIGQSGTIVVARDGRESGKMLADAICSTVVAHGFDVINADVAATPTVGVLVRAVEAVGGIQISASHNPAPYNGMKLFGANGRVISAGEGGKVLDHYHSGSNRWVSYDQLGRYLPCADSLASHLEKVLATVDVEAIRSKQFKVVLDSNRGSGSLLGRQLMQSLGCEFEILGSQPDGQFEHVPEPTAENLKSVAEKSKSFGADVVFCQDPDADRLAIIDENGNYIGEEYTLAITADHRLSKNQGPVVVNCATSRMSADIAHRHGCECVVSAVGEANVTGKMIEVDAVYGGEGNGGPIDPKVGYVRDSFVAMAQVLDAMASRDSKISELVAEIPRYEIQKSKISVARERVGELLDAVEQHFSEPTANRMDGLRLDWEDRWLLVRPSNTEPIVRAIAEAKSADLAQQMCDSVKSLAENL